MNNFFLKSDETINVIREGLHAQIGEREVVAKTRRRQQLD